MCYCWDWTEEIIAFKVLSRRSHTEKMITSGARSAERVLWFNPRPAGGGRLNDPTPPSGFSRIAKKRRRAAPPGFHPPYRPSFPQLLWKFRPKAMWGQVTRSGQVTQLQNNYHRATATMFQGKLWNFRNMMRSSVPTKRISWIFDIGDFRSGHFCDLPIISQWAKNQLCYIYFGASVFEWNHIV